MPMNEERRDRASGAPDDPSLSWTPDRMPGRDARGLRLDAVSATLFEVADGRQTVAQLAAAAGLEPGVVYERYRALAGAGLITPPPSIAPPSAAGAPEPSRERQVGERAPKAPDAGDRADEVWARATVGDLARKPGIAVLEEAATSALTGAIRFEQRGDRVECHFHKGQPLGVVSSAERHEHGTMLCEADKITSEIRDVYRTALEQGAAHAVAALIQAGLTDRKQLAIHLTWRGSAILKELAGWREGSYAVAPGLPFPKGLEQLRLLLPRRRKATSWRSTRLDEQQAAQLEAARSKYLVATPTAGQAVAGLGLDDKEQRFVEHLLSAPIQLSQAFATSTLLRVATKSLLYHLIQGGAFELHDVNPDGITPHALETLDSHLALLEKDNHFNVLTAHPVSTEREIEQRYQQRLAEYDPALYPGASEPQLSTLAAIRARFTRAWDVLGDREQRQEYRRQICGRDQLMTFIDLQLRKAEVALKMRGQGEEAVELAASALDIDPANVAARVLLAAALAYVGRVREARDQLRGVTAVPAKLQRDYEELRRKLG
jgi:tetratricopeptide (TPR) repeat protein